MVVIGISPELDVLESLEKRVRSRFNHRQIDMFPPLEFKEYFNIAQELLTPNEAGKPWNSQMKEIFKSKDLSTFLEKIYNVNNSVAYLKQILCLALVSSKFDFTKKKYNSISRKNFVNFFQAKKSLLLKISKQLMLNKRILVTFPYCQD